MRWYEVIRVTIEVWDRATRFRVVAQAKSIREAASIAAARYPNAEVRARFPIDPESFFVEEPTARAEIVSIEKPKAVAA
jgi:hypothetical protein